MCQITPVTETPVVNEPQVFTYFPTLIYTDKRPEFLDAVREVCYEYVEKAKAEQAGGGEAKPKDDNVVDADFKEVNDKK